jgi:hypothetical protein
MTLTDRVQFITVHTPIRPFGVVWLRLMFQLGRLRPKIMGIRPLGSVYFTRWSVITSIPYNGRPQTRERLHHPYLFWEVAYSGALEPYIESFVYVIQQSIKRAWGTSFGFPGGGSVTEVREYIQALEYPAAHAYSAYPQASVRMVLSAVRIQREHQFLMDAAKTGTEEDFAVVYRGFLDRRQSDL